MIEGSRPGRGWEFFSSPPAFIPALGTTQPPIQWVAGVPSLGVKWPGLEADHSPPSSAEMRGGMPPLPQYAFIAWYSVKAQE